MKTVTKPQAELNRGSDSVQRLVRKLHRLQKEWPTGVWLFADGSTLSLMRTENGQRMMNSAGCVDPKYTIESFRIPNDGGDW